MGELRASAPGYYPAKVTREEIEGALGFACLPLGRLGGLRVPRLFEFNTGGERPGRWQRRFGERKWEWERERIR